MTKAYSPTSRRRRVRRASERITDSEDAWLTFLRCIWPDGLPPPSLALVQAVRLAMSCPKQVSSWAADHASSKHDACPSEAKGSLRERR